MTRYLATPHMRQFRCIGTACEDTCCKAWDVPISAEDQARLASALGPAAEAMVNRIPNGRGGELVVLKKLADGACTQLDAAHLCGLHARLGEAVLPEICAAYPRVIGRVGDRLELTGRLSCPEVVRLALLADEAPLAEAPVEVFGRVKVRLELTPEGAPPYLAAFVAVRDALVAMCSAGELYRVADFAQRVAPFYHRQATTHEPEPLARALAESSDAHAPPEPAMLGLALQSAIGMMHSRLDAAPAFTRVVATAARTHAEAAGVAVVADPLRQLVELGPARLWQTHAERRAALGPAQTARLARTLARYAASYYLQDWYPLSATLLEHHLQLLLRVSLLRFLLVAHPDIRGDGDPALTDRAAVEVYYATSRAYDHNQAVRDALSSTLTRRGMLTLDHAAALLAL